MSSEIPTTPAGPPQALDLTPALATINTALSQHKGVEGYLDAASAQLLATVIQFMGSVGKRAVELTDAANRTAVDREDVNRAYEIESGRTDQLNAWLLGVVGLLGGGAIATGVAIKLTPPDEGQWIWWLAIGISGLVALGLLVKVFPRKRR